MIYLFANFSSSLIDKGVDLNSALLFGLIILFGTFGARLFQKLNIPQVVGCIVVGVLLGDVFNLITPKALEALEPFTMFALGMIGFMIGTALRGDIFKKYGKQFFIILLSEGVGAFLLVTVGISVMGWLVTGNLSISVAVGLVLGAIASATAPAATANVLWEYKTRGPLTAAILAIVAMDDALALLLYRGAATGAKAIMGTGHDSVLIAMLTLFGEIVGAIGLGVLAGLLLFYLLKFVKADDKILEFSIASLLLVVGISMIPKIDPILSSMMLGVTIANIMPRRGKGVFELVEKFSPPIYTSFFVLAGAHIEFAKLVPLVVIMIFVYIVCRMAGKIIGAWFGAKRSGAPATVRKYLGICLMSQAGVAIGLAILASHQFGSELGRTITMVIMIATFVTEIIGPMFVKLGVKKAGEIGMNVTEEDLIKTYTVKDVMDDQPATIAQDLLLQQILDIFSKTDSVYYPVVDDRSRIVGKITVTGIKEMFANRDVAGWLLACDVAETVQDKTTPEKPLDEIIELMKRYDIEHIPVVDSLDNDKVVGVLDYRKMNRKINAEILHRRRVADEMASAAG